MGDWTNPIPKALRWPIFWAAFWTGFGLLDYWRNTKHDGTTVSELTRVLFKTDTPRGRSNFLAFLTGGAVILARHILKD